MVVDTLDEYTRLINEAAESGADIVAFPEGCLNYVGIATRSLLIKHAVELNDNDLRNSTDFDGEPCDYSEKSPVSTQPRAFSMWSKLFIWCCINISFFHSWHTVGILSLNVCRFEDNG